jgi:hypothetical protein
VKIFSPKFLIGLTHGVTVIKHFDSSSPLTEGTNKLERLREARVSSLVHLGKEPQ